MQGPMMGDGHRVADRTIPRGFSARTFESLKVPNYRIYWASMMAQMGAMNMQMVARSLLMYDISKSAVLLGAVALAFALPMILLSLYGGVIADRLQKRNIIIAGQAALCLMSLSIGLIITFGSISWVHLIAAGVIQGTIMALMMPSRQAIVPEIVGREELMNALSLNAAGMNINRLFAPVVAGFMVEVTGFDTLYYTMAGLYIVATLIMLRLPKTGTMSLRGGGALREALAGLEYVRRNTTVLILLLITLVGTILSMPYMFLLPIFTTDIWHVGPGGYGMLMSVSGAGALVGSLVLASLSNRRRGLLYLASLLITGIALMGLSFSPWYSMALIAMIVVGVGQAGRMALSNTLIQYYTEDAYRGRVMSILMMEFGLTSFGIFGVAVLAEFIGVQLALGGAAMLLAVMSAMAWKICYTLMVSLEITVRFDNAIHR